MSAKRLRATTDQNPKAEITTVPKITTMPLELVRTPESAGWLSPVEASALLLETFGATVRPRTIQAWARDTKRPMRHVRLGHKLLVFRADLLARVME